MIHRAPLVTQQALQSAIIRNPFVVSPEMSVQEAVIKMSHAQSSLPKIAQHQQNNRELPMGSRRLLAVTEGRVVGLLSERDLLIPDQQKALGNPKIADVMTPPSIILPAAQLTDLFSLMHGVQHSPHQQLPIVDEQGQWLGVVTPESLVQVAKPVAFWEQWRVEAVMTSHCLIATVDSSLSDIAQQMIAAQKNLAVIVSNHSPTILQGVITAVDLLHYQGLEISFQDTSAQTLLTSDCLTVQPQDSLLTVADLMLTQALKPVVVTGEADQLLGWVTAPDLIETFSPHALYHLAETLNCQLEQQVADDQTQLQAKEKQPQSALKLSENYFQGILETQFQFLGFLSPEGVLLEVNQTALETANLQREAVLGKLFWETDWWQISSKNQRQLQTAIQQAAQGEEVRYEAEIGGANQSIIPVEFSLHPITDEQGKVVLLVAEGRDLTEAKRLETERQKTVELLQASQRRYASLVKASPVGIFRCDRAGNCIYTNEVASEIIGLSTRAMQGKGWQRAIHPDDREAVLNQWSRAMQEKRPFQMEYRFVHPDGTVRWVYGQSAIEQDHHQQVDGYVGTITDISDRKEAEIALETIIKGTATTTGQAFFSALVAQIRQALNVSHVLISERSDQQLKLLAGAGINSQLSNYEWAKTPCERALQEGEFYCYRSVQAEFPEDRDLVTMGVTSYFGIALRSSEGELMGTLCILNDQPIPNADRAINILRVFAARAAAELERQRANTLLETLNRELEAKVEARTAALKQREAELQDFFDNAHDLIQSVSLETGKFEYVNRSWRELLGYSRDEIAQLTVFEVLHPDCHDQCQALLAAMRNGELSNLDRVEVALLSKTGKKIIVEGGINCRWEGEQPIATRAIFRDITQRQQTEREVHLLQERLQYLLNSNPAIIYSCRPDGNNQATFISDNITTILGYSKPDFSTQINFQFWADRVHPEEREAVLARVSQLYKNNAYEDEYRFVHGKGHYIWVRDECRLVRDEQGNPVEIIGYFADITERKQNEQAIRESQEFLKSVLTVFPLYLFWKDTHSVYLGCNQNFATVAGFASPEEIVGKTDYDLPWGETEGKAYIADDQEVIASATPKLGLIETQLQSNGQQVWVETNKVPLYDGNGEIIGILGTYQDITARKQAEEQLQKTNEALLRATQLKDEFLANMSHELRTPLNVILGMTEGLQEAVYGAINEKQAKVLKTIASSGLHLLELINDILDLSKIESGKMELHCAETEIVNLCDSALLFIHQQASQKGIQVSTQIPQQLPTLVVDERRIRQVLINLLTNAVKFTPEGGAVKLDVMALAEDEERNSCIGASLRFAVCDTGIGIAPDNINRLFQPFVQIDSALNRRYEGTGLGLSLVKRIVEMHGGEVGVSSEVGVGSRFYFDLPLASPSPNLSSSPSASKAMPNPTPPSPEEMGLILLAEDDEANVMTLTSYLEAKGYRLLVAQTGAEVIQFADQHRPDLILMDIQMPDMDGIATIQHLRCASRIPTVPIIVFSALAMDGDRARCLDAGANDYFSKPVQLRTLVKAIAEQLKGE